MQPWPIPFEGKVVAMFGRETEHRGTAWNRRDNPARGGDGQRLSGSAYFPPQVFCPVCGGNIHGRACDGDFVCVGAASLDNPSVFNPTSVIFHEDAQSWDGLSQDIPAGREVCRA